MIVFLTIQCGPISDNENPLFDSCPINQTTATESGKATRFVEWDHPIATDNSGDTLTITCDHASGTNFTIGQTPVTCTALDAYGNSNSCIFYVDVKGIFPQQWELCGQVSFV